MLPSHKITISISGRDVNTLADILPLRPGLKILFVAKTPAPVSVKAGHYFQGRQGTIFWNKLADYGVLNVPYGEYHDEYLLRNGYGITDIVKVPRHFGNEPSDDEYRKGIQRILDLIELHKPLAVVFVYKRVLDNILAMGIGIRHQSEYGFNPVLEAKFNTKVFVFPMPGTPCTRETAHHAMTELASFLSNQPSTA